MLRFLLFSSLGPIALFLLLSDFGLSTPSTLIYKNCGFSEASPSPEFLEKADAFKKKYGQKARVEWINDENCQGVSLHYNPDGI